MLRDPALVPLSHQHQHALALCVRVERAVRAGTPDTKKWQDEIVAEFEHEIRCHFEVEERVLFPVAARFDELQALVTELLGEHAELRSRFAAAEQGIMTAADLLAFAEAVSAHVRKEERRLFEAVQEKLAPSELASLGASLSAELNAATCRFRN